MATTAVDGYLSVTDAVRAAFDSILRERVYSIAEALSSDPYGQSSGELMTLAREAAQAAERVHRLELSHGIAFADEAEATDLVERALADQRSSLQGMDVTVQADEIEITEDRIAALKKLRRRLASEGLT